jgi:hypothetical protein
MAGRAADLAAVIASVPGARGTHVIATRDGVVLVTLGTDEACLVESGRRFRAWVDARVPQFGLVGEAEVWVGELVFRDELPASLEGG